jgi:hypothetical protein
VGGGGGGRILIDTVIFRLYFRHFNVILKNLTIYKRAEIFIDVIS